MGISLQLFVNFGTWSALPHKHWFMTDDICHPQKCIPICVCSMLHLHKTATVTLCLAY